MTVKLALLTLQAEPSWTAPRDWVRNSRDLLEKVLRQAIYPAHLRRSVLRGATRSRARRRYQKLGPFSCPNKPSMQSSRRHWRAGLIATRDSETSATPSAEAELRLLVS